MTYIEYESLKARYEEAVELREEILDEKTILFAKTQPNGISYDMEKVDGGAHKDLFAEYLIEKEKRRIDERLAEAQALVEERRKIMEHKERELRLSDGLYDKVYRSRYIDHSSVKRIAKLIGYSKSQTYRVIERIDATLKLGKHAKKCD